MTESFTPVNVKEKIAICVDMTTDEDELPLGLSNYQPTVDQTVRSALERFIKLKNSLNSDTEFAIIGFLNNKAKWLNAFTNNPDKVIEILSSITGKTSRPNETNLDEFLFPILDENLRDHIPHKVELGNPSHVCRVLLVYKSSIRVPNINNFNFAMFNSEYVFFDVFFVHAIPSDENQVHTIFKNLSQLVKGGSYLIDVVNSDIISIFNCLSKLLAHPLQRVPQKYFNTDINDILDDEKTDEDFEEAEPTYN